MAQGVIGGNLINHRLKLGFIHIPKCGGCSITRYLHRLSNHWESLDPNEKAYAAEPFIDYKDYQLFTTVRHPVTWILSGYKFMKQRYSVEGPIGNFKPKVFKLEETYKLKSWLTRYFHNSIEAKLEPENVTEKEDIAVSGQHLEKIKTIAGKYANDYNYEL